MNCNYEKDPLEIIHSIACLLSRKNSLKIDDVFVYLYLSEMEHIKRYGFRPFGFDVTKKNNIPVYEDYQSVINSSIFQITDGVIELVGEFDSDEITGIYASCLNDVLSLEPTNLQQYPRWQATPDGEIISPENMCLDAGMSVENIAEFMSKKNLFR